MPDADSSPDPATTPLADLPADEKAARAASFGAVAAHYERFRPGPAPAAVEWLVPRPVERIVDLGAGTGALTRLLLDRAAEVVAVEPDDRMRAVLATEVPGARAVQGRGEAIPLPDGSVDAVLASSSWHWVDPNLAMPEVRRVLAPGGTLGAVWSGPDPAGDFLVQAVELLRGSAASGRSEGHELAELIPDADRQPSELVIPDGMPFTEPERETFRWTMALTADDLVGLLGTFSWVITLEPAAQARVTDGARRLLAELLGVEGDVTVDVQFCTNAFRSRPTS